MGRIKKRQEQSHLHCVTFTPDGKFLLATDLGTDCIYLFPIGKRPEAGKAHSLLDESRVVRIQMDFRLRTSTYMFSPEWQICLSHQ